MTYQYRAGSWGTQTTIRIADSYEDARGAALKLCNGRGGSDYQAWIQICAADKNINLEPKRSYLTVFGETPESIAFNAELEKRWGYK